MDEGGFADVLGAEDDEFGFEGWGEGVLVVGVVGGARHCGGGRLDFDATFAVYLGSLSPVVFLWSFGSCADRLWRTIVGDTQVLLCGVVGWSYPVGLTGLDDGV